MEPSKTSADQSTSTGSATQTLDQKLKKKCLGFDPVQIMDFSVPAESIAELHNSLGEKSKVVLTGSDHAKAEVVRQFVKDHHGQYRLIVWIDTSSISAIHVAAAKVAELARKEKRKTLSSLLGSMKKLLPNRPSWLLVFDHFDRAVFKPQFTQFMEDKSSGHFILLQDQGVADLSFNAIGNKAISKRMYEVAIRTIQGDSEKYYVNKIAEAIGGSPVAFRLALGYMKVLVAQSAQFCAVDFFPEVDFEFGTQGETYFHKVFEACLNHLKQRSDTKCKNAYALLDIWAYLHTENLPLSFIENRFSSSDDPKKAAYEALSVLQDYGFIWMGGDITYAEFSKNSQHLFMIDKRIQTHLLQRQRDESRHVRCFMTAVRAFDRVFTFNRENYRRNVENPDLDLIAVQLENVVEHVYRDGTFNRDYEVNALVYVFKALNSLGRFYQLRELFHTAIYNYNKAIKLIDVYSEWKDRTFPDYGQNEVLHNLGSASLRVWEELDEESRERAVDALSQSCRDLLNSENNEGKDGKKTYAELHTDAYSLRALARAYKKQKAFEDARDLFERLQETKEYIHWPETANQGEYETLPLSYMDLGVIYRLIANENQLSSVDGSLSSKSSSSLKSFSSGKLATLSSQKGGWASPKIPIDQITIQDAIALLEKSVNYYEAVEYTSSVKNKDLGIALIRLAEAYQDDLKGNFIAESNRFTLAAIAHCLLRSRSLLDEFYHGEASVNEARALYFLAYMWHESNHSHLALQAAEEAINSQKLLLGKFHPHLKKTIALKSRILRTLEGDNLQEFPDRGAQDILKKWENKAIRGNDSAKQSKVKIAQEIRSKSFASAIRSLSAYASNHPDDPVVCALKGYCFFQNKEYQLAGAQYLKLQNMLADIPFSEFNEVRLMDHAYYCLNLVMAHVHQNQGSQGVGISFKASHFIQCAEEVFGKKLANLLQKKKKLKKASIREYYQAYQTIKNENKPFNGALLATLANNFEKEKLPVDPNAMMLSRANTLFRELENAIERIVESFEDQIELLNINGVEQFADACVARLLKVLEQIQDIHSNRILDVLWKGLFVIKTKKKEITIKGEKCKVSVDAFLNKCGIRFEDGRAFVLAKGDRSEHFGFRFAVARHEIDLTYYVEAPQLDLGFSISTRSLSSSSMESEVEEQEDQCAVM